MTERWIGHSSLPRVSFPLSRVEQRSWKRPVQAHHIGTCWKGRLPKDSQTIRTSHLILICPGDDLYPSGGRSIVVHGLGCNGFDWIGLGRDFSVFGGLGTKVLKIWKDYVNAFKARLDKIWLQCLPIAPSSDGTVLYTTACYWLVGAPSRRQ